MNRWIFLLFPLLVSGCEDDPAGVKVNLTSSLKSAPLNSVEIEISQEGNILHFMTHDTSSGAFSGSLVLATEGEPARGSLAPGLIPIPKASAPVVVIVRGNAGSKVVREVRFTPPQEGLKEFQLVLEESCLGVLCASGSTCISGACADPNIQLLAGIHRNKREARPSGRSRYRSAPAALLRRARSLARKGQSGRVGLGCRLWNNTPRCDVVLTQGCIGAVDVSIGSQPEHQRRSGDQPSIAR